MNKQLLLELRQFSTVYEAIKPLSIKVKSKVTFSLLFLKHYNSLMADVRKCLCKPLAGYTDPMLEIVLENAGICNFHSLAQDAHRMKNYQMLIGDFQQKIIALAQHCTNLHQGHATGLDVMGSCKQPFVIELKNRHNTDNSSARKANLDKLARQAEKGYMAIYGVINDPRPKQKTIKHNGQNIYHMSGKHLSQFLYGTPNIQAVLSSIVKSLGKTTHD
jgi:hypothetical protein